MYILNMKRIKFVISLTVMSSLFFASCGSTKVEPAPAQDAAVEQPAPSAETKPVNDEYSRSVGNVTVSKDTFEADKAEIISIITKMNSIMKDFDYQSWLLYVDDESKEYWSKPSNLRKAQSKLPVKGLRLNNLHDYFKYVFVPARAGRDVTEIRYVSDTCVKAVQVVEDATETEEEKTLVYYFFNKINGHWAVHLSEIEG